VGKGWFHDGQSRYGWEWLADRYDTNGDGGITAEEFTPQVRDLLARLDRDENGKIKGDDFDWSTKSPYVQQTTHTRRLFGPIDADRNGHVTKDEWREFFERAALDGNSITPADLQAALFPPQPAQSDDDPSPIDFLRGFLSGELGAIPEGPALGGRAPDFELPDEKHVRHIRLSNFYQKKPVVLIFGSFT
jgi:Ca2+-binding EF-hand superfamily protein